MRQLLGPAILTLAAYGFLSEPAHAGSFAYPPNCRVETLVGSASGEGPTLRVVVHDRLDHPLAGQMVRLSLAATALRLYSTQDAGVTVNCAEGSLRKLTDAAGEVVFHPRFGGTDAGAAIPIDAEGLQFAVAPALSMDLDGIGGGAGLSDFATFSVAFASNQSHPEINFDRSASDLPDLADFALFAAELARGAVATYCP